MRPVADSHAQILTWLAFGNVLELGYGWGVSSRAMAKSERVTNIISWEPNVEYHPVNPGPKVQVIGGNYWPRTGDYDFVFIDHWPLQGETRKEAALYWRQKASIILVDDANLEPSLDGIAHKIENMWLLGGFNE